jgi:hypothetical protein
LRFDWRTRPNRTFIGVVLVMVGLPLEIRVFTDIQNVPIWLAFVAPFVFGVGMGILFREWREHRLLVREVREAEPPPPPWVAPEDDPNWVAWIQQQVDNPEKPTDDPEEKGQ